MVQCLTTSIKKKIKSYSEQGNHLDAMYFKNWNCASALQSLVLYYLLYETLFSVFQKLNLG